MVSQSEQAWRERNVEPHRTARLIRIVRQLTGITLTEAEVPRAVTIGDAGAPSATRDESGTNTAGDA